jgi:MoaA/NifB/PqqE/SkfB family radical SAM enzyme
MDGESDMTIPQASSPVLERTRNWITSQFLWIVAKYYLRKPDLHSLMQFKLASSRTLWRTILNELCYRMKLTKGYKITALNLEVTNHCNLACTMCPVNTTMKRAKGFMDFDLFKMLVDQNQDVEMILPFQWGEPTLHKRLWDMIEYCRDRNRAVCLTTNGTLMSKEICNRILDSGLSRITFSVDGIGETHTKIRGYPYEKLKERILMMREMRDARKSKLQIEVAMVVFDLTEREIGRYCEEWKGIVDRIELNPRYTQQKRQTSCRELWRGSVVVLWDGRVSICCVDHEGSTIIGDARNEPLSAIWNGPRMQEIRRQHSGKKFPSVCEDCSEFVHEGVSQRFS